jgi:hypothetical protein
MAGTEVTKFGHALLRDFLFDPKYKNLNHGISRTIAIFEIDQ